MVIIALGGNVSSPFGSPIHTLKWAINTMTKIQINVMSCSPFYCTKPVGCEGQLNYINAIIRVQTSMSAANLLKNLKQIEETAGRNIRKMQINGPWGPRPLDLDIVDYKGLVSHKQPACQSDLPVRTVKKMRQCSLVLPHPRAHLRPFVIRPLMDIDPFWHHPVSGLSARSLWTLLRARPEGRILHREPLKIPKSLAGSSRIERSEKLIWQAGYCDGTTGIF